MSTNQLPKLPDLHLPALRCRMGKWDYFVSRMRLDDVAQRFQMDKDKLRNPERYDEWLQREVDPKRMVQIANYLENQPERFFSSLVVTVYDGAPQWFALGVSETDTLSFENMAPLSVSSLDSLGVLRLSGGEDLFPIDGQHRLAGIREALKKQPDLHSEIISVIFVADRGKVQTRRLFSTLNRYAVPVNKGERIILDEDDAMAITTRRLLRDYPLFKENRVAAPKKLSLPASDKSSFSTAYTLYTINTRLCVGKDEKWNKKYLTGSLRPEDEELDELYSIATRFWDLMTVTFTSIEDVKGENFASVVTLNRNEGGGHLLFRPVGQMGLAQAIYKLEQKQISWEQAFELLQSLPFNLNQEPWRGSIWNKISPKVNGTILGNAEGQTLIADLLVYYTGHSSEAEQGELLARYRKATGNSETSLPTLSDV